MPDVLLHGGVVFDGIDVMGVADVLVADGRIAAVGTNLTAPDRVPIIDCRGRTIVPGLIDAHVHVAWAGLDAPPADVSASTARDVRNVELLLRAGVTTVRDTGGPLDVLADVAEGCASGRLRGPDIVHCGRILCAPGGHGTEMVIAVPIARECSGPTGFRAGVHEQLAGGARVIKVALNGADGHLQLTRDELLATVDEAHAAGVRVACHASVRAAIALAIDCGVDTIEHGNGLDEELAARMADEDIALIPTVAIFQELKDQLAPGDELRTPVEQRVRDHVRTIAAAVDAGVTIGFGTDRVPGGHVVGIDAEARALRSHGLTPLEILRTATSGSAKALGLDDRGQILVGSRADLAVFKGDVSTDIGLLREPALVVRQGQTIDPHLVQAD